jgi:signal transduction histidine kinase
VANKEAWRMHTLARRGAHVADGVAPPRGIAGERWLRTFATAAQQICAASLGATDPALAIAQAIDETSARLRCGRSSAAEILIDHAMGDPQMASVSPGLAVHAHLALVAGAIGSRDAFLWLQTETGALMRLAALRNTDGWESVEALASLTCDLTEPFAVRNEGSEIGVRICQRGVCQGVLVLTDVDETQAATAETLAPATAKRLSVVLERWHLLNRNQTREQALLKASEKRMARLGYDLHDGPLQEIASLAAEIGFVRADIEPLVRDSARAAIKDGFESLIEQAARLEQAVRGIAQSLETSALRRESLDVLIRREIAGFQRRTGIATVCRLGGELVGLTESQRIALYRVVQEALTNVREHSDASRVAVELLSDAGGVKLTISDNGQGFDVPTELEAAARRGRLGLIGIAERIRLLGGLFRISSMPGCGTTLALSLAPWSPIAPPADQTTPSPYYFS